MSPPRVLVTRAAAGGSELADRLRALGAAPVLIPAIELAAPATYTPLDAALATLDRFHWLLFTSANAVEAFARRLQTRRVPHFRDSLTVAKVGAIGPATARALEMLGLTPDLIPPQAVAESLTEALLPHTHQPDGTPTRFLLIRAEEARELLPETLRAAGAEVTVVSAYRTVIPASSITALQGIFKSRVPHSSAAPSSMSGFVSSSHSKQGAPFAASPRLVGPEPNDSIAAITFTSSSTARNLLALCEQAGVTLPPSALRISIGPITSRTLRELGLPPHAEAPEATVRSLAETVVETLRLHRT